MLGFPLGVLYKFFDDQGGYLAAVVTYYAFVSVFPLLLIASSVLGFVLQGNTQLQEELLTSALSQFPIVGTQLGRPEGLTGSTSAVVVGSLAALYGVIGLGQAAQNAVNVAWAVPRNSRMNPILSRLSSLLLITLAGLTVLAITLLSSVGSHLDMFGPNVDQGLRWVVWLASVAPQRRGAERDDAAGDRPAADFMTMLPGGLVIAVLWQMLQLVGGVYVQHVIGRANQMNAVFALVLGLVALLYIAAVMAMFGVEVNVVLARRLYPRALLTPFTDDVELTDADERAYRDYAKAQRHKGFQRVRVTFDPPKEEDDATPPQPEPQQPPADEESETGPPADRPADAPATDRG